MNKERDIVEFECVCVCVCVSRLVYALVICLVLSSSLYFKNKLGPLDLENINKISKKKVHHTSSNCKSNLIS